MWIIYIPRERREADLPGADGTSLWDEAQSWLAHKKPDKLKPENIRCAPAALSGVSSEDTIYLLPGVTGPGRTEAEWPHQANPLTVLQMADRLIGAGLRTDFGGSLKVYCSHGAEPSGDGAPFVQRFAEEMVRRGYAQCSIYGYLGEVTLHYVNSEDPAEKAKFAKAPELLNQGWHRYSTHESPGFFSRRAQDAKVRF